MAIPEKSLEINFVRNFLHSYHFVWQGATLREEAHGGWDVKIEQLYQGQSFILQFKRPYKVIQRNRCETFVFSINNNNNRNQNELLSKIAADLGYNNVFYAFPCVKEMSQLTNPRNAILDMTALADINQPNLIRLGGGVQHRVEIEFCNGLLNKKGLVFSEPRNINLMTIHDYKEWGFELVSLKEKLRNVEEIREPDIRYKSIRINFITKSGP